MCLMRMEGYLVWLFSPGMGFGVGIGEVGGALRSA
jgi:hypothetical protein